MVYLVQMTLWGVPLSDCVGMWFEKASHKEIIMRLDSQSLICVCHHKEKLAMAPTIGINRGVKHI